MNRKADARLSLSVIVLTCNEARHIQRCIESVKDIAVEIFVVDSGSTDETISLAESLGTRVFRNPWPGNQALQFNWALDNLPIMSEWVLRLDADEYPTPELISEIHTRLATLPNSVTGVTLPLGRVFLGRKLKRGVGAIRLLRLFRYGKARYANRLMDEHLEITEGSIVDFDHAFFDHSLLPIGDWIIKHNHYAQREALQMLGAEFGGFGNNKDSQGSLSNYATAKNSQKQRYLRAPLFLRAFAYFCVRYFLKLGFLEGKEGFLWHFFQGWWYRTLVDAKILEIKRTCDNDPEAIRDYILKR